jgi:hypothetical protein
MFLKLWCETVSVAPVVMQEALGLIPSTTKEEKIKIVMWS